MNAKKYNIEFLYQPLEDKELIKKSKLIKTQKYTMGAITSRGTNKLRKLNQDYSAIAAHPRNENLAFMVIADGKSDSIKSELASQILVEELSSWFTRLSKTYINNPMILEPMLLGELRNLNLRLHQSNNNKGIETSFALAVKGKKETFIANVGNCRCYTINNDEITMQTTDDLRWYAYNSRSLITPDEVKFLIGKDFLERTIGGQDNSKRHFEPFTQIISNKNYDSLILTTHGVTDVLDSTDLKKIVKDKDVEEVLDNIIYDSIYSKPKQTPEKLLNKFETEKSN